MSLVFCQAVSILCSFYLWIGSCLFYSYIHFTIGFICFEGRMETFFSAGLEIWGLVRLWKSLFYSPFSNFKVLGNLICSSVPPPVSCAWEISLCPAALVPTFSSLLLSTLCGTPMLREIPLSSTSLSPIYLYPMLLVKAHGRELMARYRLALCLESSGS